MADVLKAGLAWLTGQLRDHVSQIVTYARDYDSVDVHATLGKKLLKIQDADGGIRVEWTDLDFLLPAAELVIDNEALIPQRGDLVYLPLDNGDVEVFEVFPFGNEPPWRWSDPNQTLIRIHCKHLDTERQYH